MVGPFDAEMGAYSRVIDPFSNETSLALKELRPLKSSKDPHKLLDMIS